MNVGESRVYSEEGRRWLRVSPGHAVTLEWLRDRAPDLYAQWWTAPSAEVRDQVALRIERRLEELESSGPPADRHQQQAQPSALADRVALYENNAERLFMIALDDPGRPAAHLARQAEGDALRDEVAATHSGDVGDLLERRLDAADLIADRPLIDAISGMTMQVDRLAAWALAGAGDVPMSAVGEAVVRPEMAAEDPHAALRADALSSVARARTTPVRRSSITSSAR